MYASHLRRARHSAAPLAQLTSLRIQVRDGLREAKAGHLEMKSDPEAVRLYLKTYLAWINGHLHVRMPGGERGHEVVARVDRVLEEMSSAGHRSVVAFSHGATIRAWSAARVSNLSADFVAANPLQNLGGVLVEGSPEKGWKALSYQAHNLSGPRTIPLEGATARPSGLGRSSQKPNHATTGGAPGMSPREPDAAEPSLLTDKRPDLHWRDAPPTAASPSPRRHSRKREALPALAELFARRPDLELFRTAAVLEEHVRWGA